MNAYVVKGNLILKQKNSKLQIHLLEPKVNAINTFTTALNANVVVAYNDTFQMGNSVRSPPKKLFWANVQQFLYNDHTLRKHGYNTLRKHGYNTNQLIWFHLHQEVRGKDGLQKKIKFWNLLKKILDVLHEAYVLLHDQLTARDWKDPGNVFGSSVEMEDEGVNISDWAMLDCFALTWKLFWEGTEDT